MKYTYKKKGNKRIPEPMTAIEWLFKIKRYFQPTLKAAFV